MSSYRFVGRHGSGRWAAVGLFAAALAIIAAAPRPAWAGLTFELNGEFSGAQAPQGTTPWLTAAFEDKATNEVQLTLSGNNLVDQEFVSGWYFNFDHGTFNLSDLKIEGLSGAVADLKNGNKDLSIQKGVNAFKADGDGFFDILLSWQNGTFKQGSTATYRLTYTGTGAGFGAASFYYASVNGPAEKTGFYSAAHVQGIALDSKPDGSGWVGDKDGDPDFGPPPPNPVPEPSTIALAVASAIPLVVIGLRRRRSNTGQA